MNYSRWSITNEGLLIDIRDSMIQEDSKNALIYISSNDYMAFEVAEVLVNKGYTISFLFCDSCVGVCDHNRIGGSLFCHLCHFNNQKMYKSFISHHMESVKDSVKIKDLLYHTTYKQKPKPSFVYNSIQELKDLKFHDIEIGYGAFSTYVSFTRNITPDIDDTFRCYIDNLLLSEIRLIYAVEYYLNNHHVDLIVFHNGRFNNLKPLYGLAEKYHYHYIATEVTMESDGTMMKNNFIDQIPHSFDAIKEKTDIAGKNAGPRLREIGESFFEKRRYAEYSGDKVYTKNQQKGLLPEGVDMSKRNIAIFNSSEDEYFSISKSHDNSCLYPNQYIALKRLFEHYKTDTTIHFYLRIHPNLRTVRWKSHTLLYELKYPNVTIIPPESPVSSYALMEMVEKVIVFNSTIGLESSYWGKPVIMLSDSEYARLNVVHQPKSEDEFFTMIDNPNLPPKGKIEDFQKAGCFNLGLHSEKFDYYPVKRKVLHIGGHELLYYSNNSLLCSSKLYVLVQYMFYYLPGLIGRGRKYLSLLKPQTTWKNEV